MDERLLNRKKMICLCCMEEHDVEIICRRERNVFKGESVEYPAKYYYCDRTDEFYADEMQISDNDIAMKNAYRSKMGFLTSEDICAIRTKYGISQSDLSLLLGWGGKTITRYEGHQVQDIAHDTILRKLQNDPEWFLALLEKAKVSLSADSYQKYYNTAISLFEKNHDSYLRKAIQARYARYTDNSIYNGNRKLCLDTVVDVIRYFSNAMRVTNLYKVKLMKFLWYSDFLSYKRRGHAITGLVYQALPMGAVPIAHDSIIDLHGVEYDEIDMGDGTGYHFKESPNREYQNLSQEDMDILDEVIGIFGQYSTDAIVSAMHEEEAYKKTPPRDIISFQFAERLSIG